MEGCRFNQLSLEEENQLEEAFLMEEMKGEVWEYDGDKFLGPDEFNFNFIRKCWNSLSRDILNFMTDFHGKANLSKAVTSSFIALVLKVNKP